MSLNLRLIGRYETGIFDDSAAEIVAHDADNQRLYVVNGAQNKIDVLDITDPSSVSLISQIDAANPNSVAYSNGVIAVASANDDEDSDGQVLFFDKDGNSLGSITVGNLPDMLTFTPDGSKLLVANEGEAGDTATDPLGSISIIDMSNGVAGASETNLDFTAFDSSLNDLIAAGVRIFPGKSVSEDVEPEYIAVSADGAFAFVTLQENNAVAVVDISNEEILDILPLGTKDHSVDGNGFDASDRDDAINIQTHPVLGLYMPDSIASYDADGQTYFVTANEGDARDEDDRIKDLTLDPTAFPDAATLQEDENLGRLEVSTIDGDTDGDGDFDQLFSYGSRSFTIWDADGNVVFDSGDQFEQITASLLPDDFNSSNDDNDDFDSRSDAKGPEPEGVTIGEVAGKTYAFIGLERIGGIMVYDVSNPANAEFVQYVNTRDFSVAADTSAAGDLGPEGIAFIAAEDSPNGIPLLAVGNEVSGTTAIFELLTPISAIQGAGHVSEFEGEQVATYGIVTAVDFNGFYLQDPVGDGNDATSEGIFVFTGSGGAKPEVGDEIEIVANVSEFIPGGAGTGNLSITQLSSGEFSILSSGNDLPTAVLIGENGRLANSEVVISDDELPVNLQDEAGNFDPENDAIDFYESLEGMRVEIEDPIAVSPTRVFSGFSAEFFTVPNNGANVTPTDALTERGGINLVADADGTGDLNPERVQVQFAQNLFGDPVEITVGDQLSNITGVVGYSFGNFEVNVTDPFSIVAASGLTQETTDLIGNDDQLTIASYNVLNLTSTQNGDPDAEQRTKLANQIVNNLQTPDIIALQEIQDNNGTTNDGTTDATQTLQDFVDAIALAGGPTYSFFDVAPADGTGGGVPGGNIRNAFLYNADRVDLVSFKSLTPDVLASDFDVTNSDAFVGTRDPLLATFSFNGEEVTVINNHLTSRFGSTPIFGGPQPFVQAGEVERETETKTLNEVVDNLLALDADANILVTGDLNTFEFTDDLAEFLPGTGSEKVLSNLVTEKLEGDEAYTFIFDGNSQVLDHMFVTDGLLDNAEFDIVHVNNDFTRDDNGAEFSNVLPASDHEPIISRLTIEEPQSVNFTLQILHASDLEGGVDAIDSAPNFATIIDEFDQEFANTVILSAGDNFLSGPFFNAAGDRDLRDDLQAAYQTLFGEADLTNIREGNGRVDVSIMNIIGFEASALGNHEFDLGTDTLEGIIGTDIRGTELGDVRWLGAQFPYLSANLDFTNDGNLSGLFTSDILSNTDFQSLPTDLAAAGNAPKIAPATIIEEGGEQIGVVGATTQLLASISSPGDTEVLGNGANDMAELAGILQPVVDQLTSDGVNKIILVSHLQQIVLEQELAGLLSGVDVIIAGGSDTLLADSTDRLRAGDVADADYPFETTDKDGNPVLVVSTDGEYSYVGRLVLEFDENGNVITSSIDETVSGAYATDEQGVLDVTGDADLDTAIANSTKGTEVQKLTDAVSDVVIAKDGDIAGKTAVFLEGRREFVRTEETNIGNLTADANLAKAKEFDAGVLVSIKNGGGLRAPIGEIDGLTGDLLPPQGNPAAGKDVGEISQLDIENTLRFNNGLTILTLTAAELLEVMEHAVSASAEGATPGQFPQVGGLSFSFDQDLAAGDRIQSMAITDEDGNILDVVVQNSELQGDADREIKIVTLNFLAGGGDGYPFPTSW